MSPRSFELLSSSIVIILCAALLIGCGGPTMITRPNLPDLPASVRAPCAEIKTLGSDDPALIWEANAYHMKALADCSGAHGGAVAAYDKARAINNGVK